MGAVPVATKDASAPVGPGAVFLPFPSAQEGIRCGKRSAERKCVGRAHACSERRRGARARASTARMQ
eukprot:14657852-Alexandrium_andersonii.AAC.1